MTTQEKVMIPVDSGMFNSFVERIKGEHAHLKEYGVGQRTPALAIQVMLCAAQNNVLMQAMDGRYVRGEYDNLELEYAMRDIIEAKYHTNALYGDDLNRKREALHYESVLDRDLAKFATMEIEIITIVDSLEGLDREYVKETIKDVFSKVDVYSYIKLDSAKVVKALEVLVSVIHEVDSKVDSYYTLTPACLIRDALKDVTQAASLQYIAESIYELNLPKEYINTLQVYIECLRHIEKFPKAVTKGIQQNPILNSIARSGTDVGAVEFRQEPIEILEALYTY